MRKGVNGIKKPSFQAADFEGSQRGRGGREVEATCRRILEKADHGDSRRHQPGTRTSIAAVRRKEGKAGKRQTETPPQPAWLRRIAALERRGAATMVTFACVARTGGTAAAQRRACQPCQSWGVVGKRVMVGGGPSR